MNKIEKKLHDSRKAYLELQQAMVDLEASRHLVHFSDDVHDKLASVRLIFDYIFTKFGNQDFRRDCIVDFKVSEMENILEALDSFVAGYQDLIKSYREKPAAKNLSQQNSA
ncbi:MAG: hypothetical protein JXQ83_10250 [Candidatus Glassbacteria bacterium]|nr:hypothetical protein [Candidatus Glassbacteria bacterium]